MQTKKYFLFCGVATGVLIAATAAMGQIPPPGPVPTSCTLAGYPVAVTSGPSLVNCTGSTTGVCTEIEYTVSSTASPPDHIVFWQGVGVVSVTGDIQSSGVQIFPVGEPDNLTNAVGTFARHEQAIRANPNAGNAKIVVRLAGNRGKNASSLLIKKGKVIESCRIVGVGLETGPGLFDEITTSQTFQVGGCIIKAQTPAMGPVVVTTSSPCTLSGPFDVEDLVISLPGLPASAALAAVDLTLIHEGSTCTTKQIPDGSGKLYTVCK